MATIMSSAKYQPFPRYRHISGRVGGKVVVQGGISSTENLSSVVEIFDPYTELWEQKQVEGNAPSPGTYGSASASLHGDLYSFGGTDGKERFNTVHRLDTKTWCWSLLSPQNAYGAPTPKCNCGMITVGNSLIVFGGYGKPQGSIDPQSFIEKVKSRDGAGWTNEFHIFDLSESVWSCPATTGERPPPCSSITFTAVDDQRGVVFGGYNGRDGHMNDVYIIHIPKLIWSKLHKSEGGLWPTVRSHHATCCLDYGQQFPQLLVTGGLDMKDVPLTDVWILDLESGKWKMEGMTLKARALHSVTAFSLAPGLIEVIIFGGSSKNYSGNDAKQAKVAETTLLTFKSVKISGKFQWVLESIIDNTDRGSHERICNKFRETAESWQQFAAEINTMRQIMQREEKEKLRFCAMVYYTNINPRSFELHLFIVPHLDTTVKEIKEQCKNFEEGDCVPFDINEETIVLHLPERPISGWTLKNLSKNEMKLDVIVNNRPIFPFRVGVKWAGSEGEQIQRLEHELIMANNKIFICSPDKCKESYSDGSIAPKAFADFPEPKVVDLMNIVSADVESKWESVGLGLGLETPVLKTISKDNNNVCSCCMREVFTRWYDNGPEYSWQKLAEVLCSATVQQANLLPRILEKVKKLQ